MLCESIHLSNGLDKLRIKEPNSMSTSKCEKSDNFAIVSTTLLIGLNIGFY